MTNAMQLYLKTRVKKLEASEEFQGFLEKNRKRREGAEKAVETKTAKLLKEVSKWKIKL
jgi:hypothetical protein